MTQGDHKPEKRGEKRDYVPPKLERLGTIRDLTLGAGKNNVDDGEHPPGLNKSRFS